MKFSTPVEIRPLETGISLSDKIVVLGSCFADSVGSRMKTAGFDVLVNPFGTLYNPASICLAVDRLDSGVPFTSEDCVEMGAGAGLICSFEHHTSFAKPTEEAFLESANRSLEAASEFWRASNKVIVTLGTSFVWKHCVSDSKTKLFLPLTNLLHLKKEAFPVSNCLKRPAYEYTREMLATADVSKLLDRLVKTHPDKKFILTVSPIRHLSDGAHANTISKSTLHLGIAGMSAKATYFPAYEILNDELRDYRFYAEDLVHPSNQAAEFVWEKFVEAAVPKDEHEQLKSNEKAARREAHRPLR